MELEMRERDLNDPAMVEESTDSLSAILHTPLEIELPVLELQEYRPLHLKSGTLRDEEVEELINRYSTVIDVEWISPNLGGGWRLQPQGYVGLFRLASGRVVRVAPKVPIGNIFRMLDYVWNVDIRSSEDEVAVETIEDLYRRLAVNLARRTLRRSRQGFYRSYIERRERLAAVRGQFLLPETLATPWIPSPACRYNEQTANVDDNRIVATALERILRSGLCTGDDRHTVARAFREISSVALPGHYSASDCGGRQYNRLNTDYRMLHLLSRFFLDQSGPTHHRGTRESIPFLLNMAQLFEGFVVEWLRRNGPEGIDWVAQHHTNVNGAGIVHVHIDIVATEGVGGPIIAVLDTKYKRPKQINPADLYQIQSYASLHSAPVGILIYPAEITDINLPWGTTTIRTLPFSLEGDLDEGGRLFLEGMGLG